MAENSIKEIPDFKSLDDLVEFFDNNDMGEYWEQMPEANFEIDLKKRTYLFALDAELAGKLIEIAKLRQTSPELLLNDWLKEKIEQEA